MGVLVGNMMLRLVSLVLVLSMVLMVLLVWL